MSIAIETESYLVLETNRSIFRSGETAEVLQRWLSRSGFSREARPPVRTFLSSNELAADLLAIQKADKIFTVQTGFPQREAAFHVGTLITEGLPSGSYLLQALSGENGASIEAEQSIVILDDEEYERYWLELANEKVIDPEMIVLPGDLVTALHDCMSSERFTQQLAASDIGLEYVRVTDVRRSDKFGPVPPLSRPVFDWVHAHLLAAAYEMAFGGGNLTIDLVVLDDLVWTQIAVERRQTDQSRGWPSYLKYVEIGAGAEINYENTGRSSHLVQCRLPYDNPLGPPNETPPEAAAGAPAPVAG